MAVLLPGREALDPARAAWLVGLCCAVLLIEFDVSAGRTRPVQLVLMPMLLLLPPALVPLLIAAAHVLVRVPRIVAGRSTPQRAILALADPWFCVPPALLLATVGLPGSASPCRRLVLLAALASQFLVDFGVSAVRLRVGPGRRGAARARRPSAGSTSSTRCSPRSALLAAAVGRHEPRRGGRRARARRPARRLRARAARPDRHRARAAPGDRGERGAPAVDRPALLRPHRDPRARRHDPHADRLGRAGVRPGLAGGRRHRPARARASRRRARARHLPRRVSRPARSASRSRPSGGSRTRTAAGATWRRSPRTCSTTRASAASCSPRATSTTGARSRSSCATAPSTTRSPSSPTARCSTTASSTRSRARRATTSTVAVLFLDLDDFKLVNDPRGHARGRRAARPPSPQRLRGCLRSADTAARLGGDEFGVLLETRAGPERAVQIAERILAAFAEPLRVKGEPMAVPLSIGITISAARRAQRRRAAAPGRPRDVRGQARRQAPLGAATTPRSSSPCARPGRRAPRDVVPAQRGAARGDRRPARSARARSPASSSRSSTCAPGSSSATRRWRASSPRSSRPPNAWFAQAHRCGLGYELEARAIASALAAPGRPAGTYLTVNMSPVLADLEPRPGGAARVARGPRHRAHRERAAR